MRKNLQKVKESVQVKAEKGFSPEKNRNKKAGSPGKLSSQQKVQSYENKSLISSPKPKECAFQMVNLHQRSSELIDLLKQLQDQEYDDSSLVNEVTQKLWELKDKKMNSNFDLSTKIRFQYEAVKYFNTIDEKKLQAYEILKQMLINPADLVKRNFSVLNLRLFMLKLKYDLIIKDKLSCETLFKYEDSRQIMKYLQMTESQRKLKQEQKNEILIWINSLAYHYRTAKQSQFIDNPDCFDSVHKRLIQDNKNLDRLRIQNQYEVFSKSLTFNERLQFSLEKNIDMAFEMKIREANSESYYKKLFRNYKDLEQILDSKERQVEITRRQTQFYLISPKDYFEIRQEIRQRHSENKKVFLPFFNLQSVYFNLHHERQWLKLYQSVQFLRIPKTLWKLFQYFGLGIRIKRFISQKKATDQKKKSEALKDSSDERSKKSEFQIERQQIINEENIAPLKDEISEKTMSKLNLIPQQNRQNSPKKVTAKRNYKDHQDYLQKQKQQGKHQFLEEQKAQQRRHQKDKIKQEKSSRLDKKIQPKSTIFADNNQDQYYQHSKPKSYHYEKERLSRGIQNRGNTCYVNSALQCLHKTPILKLELLAIRQSQENFFKLPLSSESYLLFSQLSKQEYYQPCNSQPIRKIVAENNIIFQGHRQNDSLEFVNTFLSVLSQQLNTVSKSQPKPKIIIDNRSLDDEGIYEATIKRDSYREASVIEDIFTGRYKTTYTCTICKEAYKLFQKFKIHYLSLPPPEEQSYISHNYNWQYYNNSYYHKPQKKYSDKKWNLSSCLKEFQKEETLDGDDKMNCQKCGKDTQTKKTMQIYKAGQILIIGLKRFYSGRKNEGRIKIEDLLFPTEIQNKKDAHPEKGYKLYAVLLHHGSLQCGHYTAVCYDIFKKCWIEYSDSHTKRVEFQSIRGENVYGLFYQLVDAKQLTSFD